MELSKLGRYELITRIGQGGMAEVQLAVQRGPAGFEKLVVVKLVHDGLAKPTERRAGPDDDERRLQPIQASGALLR